MSGRAIIDEVIEREPSIPKAILIKTAGFPSTTKFNQSLAAVPKKNHNDDKKKLVIPDEKVSSTELIDTNAVSSGENDSIANDNLRSVLSMSLEERESALREIEQLLSPKSIAFLTKPSQQSKFKNEIAKFTQSELAKSTTANTHISHSFSGKKNSWIPKTSEELETAIAQAPKTEQDKLKWTNASETNNDFIDNKTTSTEPLTKTMSRARFDLKGNRVLTSSEVTSSVEQIFSSLHPTSLLPPEELTSIVSSFAALMASPSVDFYSTPPRTDAQPQHELLNHQSDQSLPGYTFAEISEMFRSETRGQHEIALQMLTGIIQRRNTAVSLECYYTPVISTSTSIVTVNNKLFHHSDCVSQSVRPVVPQDARVNELFSVIVNRIVASIQSRLVETSSSSYPASQWRRKICRLVSFAVQQIMCSADLPPEIPTLLLWGLQRNQRYASKSKLLMYNCLISFTHSTYEDRVRDSLWYSLWSVYGVPILPSPLSRRSEFTYEEEILNSDENLKQIGSDSSQPNSGSVLEEFALQCRWSRADALSSTDSALRLLATVVLEGCQLLLIENNRNEHGSHILSNESTLVLDAALLCLELLKVLIRNVRKQSSVQSLFELIKSFFPTSFEVMVSLSPAWTHSGHVKVVEKFKMLWWSIMTDLSQRDYACLIWILQQKCASTISVFEVVLRELKPEKSVVTASNDNRGADEVIFSPDYKLCMCRFVRVAVAYGNLDSLKFVRNFTTASSISDIDSKCDGITVTDQKNCALSFLNLQNWFPSDSSEMMTELVQVYVETAASMGSIIIQFIEAWKIFEKRNRSSESSSDGLLIGYLSSLSQDQLNTFTICLEMTKFLLEESLALTSLLPQLFGENSDFTLQSGCESITLSAILTLLCNCLDPNDSDSLDSYGDSEATSTSKRPFDHSENQQNAGISNRIFATHGVSLVVVAKQIVRIFDQLGDVFHSKDSRFGETVSSLATCYALCAPIASLLSNISHALAELSVDEHLVAATKIINDLKPRQGSTFHLMDNMYSSDLRCNYLRLVFVLLSFSTDKCSQNTADALVDYCVDQLDGIMTVPCVSDGLHMWQQYRILEAQSLIMHNLVAILFIHRIVNETKFIKISLSVVYMLRSCKYPAKGILISILTGTIPLPLSDEDRTELLSAVWKQLGYSISASSHGTKQITVSKSFLNRFQGEIIGKISVWPNVASHIPDHSLYSWMLSCGASPRQSRHGGDGKFNTIVHGKSEWIFRLLLQLDDPHFSQWLGALCGNNMFLARHCIEDNVQFCLYILMAITTPEEAYRWIKKPTSSRDTLCSCEPDEAAVTNYLSLLVFVFSRFCSDAEKLLSFGSENAVVRKLVEIVYAESPSTTLRRHANSTSAHSSLASESGLIELCDRLLEACTSQQISASLHAAVVTTLLHPLMPWRLQLRVWDTLGKLRVLHLLDLNSMDSTTNAAVYSLLTPLRELMLQLYTQSVVPTDKALLIRTVLEALQTLRSPEDRIMSVCALGSKLLASYLEEVESSQRDGRYVRASQYKTLCAGIREYLGQG